MGFQSRVNRDIKRMMLDNLLMRDCVAILNAFLAVKLENESSRTSFDS